VRHLPDEGVGREQLVEAPDRRREETDVGDLRLSLLVHGREALADPFGLGVRREGVLDLLSEGGVEKPVDAEVRKAGGVAHLLAHLVEVDGAERAERRGGHPPITEDLPHVGVDGDQPPIRGARRPSGAVVQLERAPDRALGGGAAARAPAAGKLAGS
jgi:hypothetical protein